MIASRLAAASLALSLTVGAMPAQAQSNADPEEIASAVRFGLPALFEGYRTRCSATLSPEGFVAQNAERLAAKFADGADARWSEAKGALLSLGADEGLEPDLVAGMPDEALKPFVTGILQQMAATEIQPDQCSDVERGLEVRLAHVAREIAAATRAGGGHDVESHALLESAQAGDVS